MGVVFDLSPWRDLTPVRALSGGSRNTVIEARDGMGNRFAVRRSTRPLDSLDWELNLVEFLAEHGFLVPATVPPADGRHHADSMVVQTWLDGHLPTTDGDWAEVARQVARLHELTADYPQRPACAASYDLLTSDRGGDIELTAMPEYAVRACRQAWRALAGSPTAVIHGDLTAHNLRINHGRAGFLDWDETRVDHTALDLADLPDHDLVTVPRHLARAASTAWEAANG